MVAAGSREVRWGWGVLRGGTWPEPPFGSVWEVVSIPEPLSVLLPCPGPTPALRASVPPAAPPARPWLPARRAPLSGRGRMPAAGQEVQAVPHPQALVGCGDSTLRTLQG